MYSRVTDCLVAILVTLMTRRFRWLVIFNLILGILWLGACLYYVFFGGYVQFLDRKPS